MAMNGWISVSERLPESGQEVLIYYFDEGYDIHQISILDYFCKDAVMDERVDYTIELPEKRLLDALFNPANQIKAPKDGFYVYDEAEETRWRKHADIITHWQPLPNPPGKARMTNYELIKYMTLEELAVTIMCPNELGLAEIECDRSDNVNCCRCCLEWLQQESGGFGPEDDQPIPYVPVEPIPESVNYGQAVNQLTLGFIIEIYASDLPPVDKLGLIAKQIKVWEEL